MPCYHPLTGFYASEVNVSGKRSLVFTPAASFSGVAVKIACGQCIGCRLERARQWAVRCLHENKLHKQSRFLTLTYDDENLPAHGVLVKRDLQLFMKRLRKAYGERRIRFFGCGEYGSRSNRPHYHILLFGHHFEDERRIKCNERGEPLRVSRICERLWPYGNNIVGDVTFDSACYVARYVVEKVNGDRAVEHYGKVLPDGEIIEMPREFVLMSRRPGIGTGYFERYRDEIYRHDNVVVDGKEVPLPRYYDLKMEKYDAELLKRLKIERRRRIDLKEQTPERRRVRERVTEVNLSRFSREIK